MKKHAAPVTVKLPEDEEDISFCEALRLLNTIVCGLEKLSLTKDTRLSDMLGLKYDDIRASRHTAHLLRDARNRLLDSTIDHEKLGQDIADQNYLDAEPKDNLPNMFEVAGLDFDKLISIINGAE